MISKNRDRLIEHEAVTALFNATVKMAKAGRLLSGKHFSVVGTLIQVWAGYKRSRCPAALGGSYKPRTKWCLYGRKWLCGFRHNAPPVSGPQRACDLRPRMIGVLLEKTQRAWLE